MSPYETVFFIINFTLCTGSFVYSAARIFRKNTPGYFVFLCLADLCFIFEEISAVVYAACGNTGTDGEFQVSILGFVSVLLFLLTGSCALSDECTQRDEKYKRAQLLACAGFLPIIAVFAFSTVVCLRFGRTGTLILLIAECIPLFPCIYSAAKHCLLSKHSDVCRKTLPTNITLIIIYLTNLLFGLFYVLGLTVVTDVLTLLCGVEIAVLTVLCVKEHEKWAI